MIKIRYFIITILSGLLTMISCERTYDEALKIAYIAPSSPGNLYIMDEDGGNNLQITFHGQAQNPCFSADGEKILYIDQGTDRMVIIDLYGNELSSFNIPDGCSGTAWSSGEHYIATYKTNHYYVYTHEGVLLYDKSSGITYVGGITFLSNNELIIGTNANLFYIWNLTSDTMLSYSTLGGANTYSALSADREKYIWYASGPGYLCVVSLNPLSTVSLGTGFYQPAWFSDGNRIIYVDPNAPNYLHIYNTKTGTSSALTDFPAFQPAVQCMPR